MANISQTYSGDFSSFMVGKIFDILSDAKSQREKAKKQADKYGVDVEFTPGEFTARSARDELIRSTLGNKFVPKKNIRDLISRGQSTPFASPLASDYFNRGQSSALPTAAQKASKAGQLFPNVAVGAPLSAQVRPQTPAVPSSSSASVKPTTGEKPVKVKDEKLGVFLAAVVKSLNLNIDSINRRLDETESGVIQAKEGIFGTIKQLEYNSDILDSKLDSIIDALREQNLLAKNRADEDEVSQRETETEKEFDLSDTERIIKPDEKKDDTIQLNLLEDIRENADKREEQLSLPFVGGSEGFERGGIASGPDSGYLAKLHGDEMIIPLDNNATQKEPSAVDGVVRKPPMLTNAYEGGTKLAPLKKETSQTLSSMGSGIMNNAMNVDDRGKKLEDSIGKLYDAMEFSVQATGVITMGAVQNAITSMGALAGNITGPLASIGQGIAASFGISNPITNLVTNKSKAEEKSAKRSDRTQNFKWEENKKPWWDPRTWFKGGDGGGRRGAARGLSTRGVRAGFTGMGSTGFNAISGGSGYQMPQSRAVGRGSRPLLGRGAYVAPTARGASRYVKPGGGIIRSITPGGATGSSLIDIFEPQRVVQPKTFDKGKRLADKVLSNQPMTRAGGTGGTSALRERLRQQLVSGQAVNTMTNVSGLGRGAALVRVLSGVGRVLGKASKIPLLTDMLFPESTAAYDQTTGPNAMYNDPRLSPSQRSAIYQSIHGPASVGNKASIVNMSSQQQALSKFNRQNRQPDPVIINNQTAEDYSSDIPQSHISNMGDPGFSALYPSPR